MPKAHLVRFSVLLVASLVLGLPACVQGQPTPTQTDTAAAQPTPTTPTTPTIDPPRGELIADGVVRFTEANVTDAQLDPSVAMLKALPSLGPVPDDFSVEPLFFYTDDDKPGFAIETAPGTSFYGTGEVAGPLLRNGRVIDAFNYDAYGYGDASKKLYQSHPWVLAVRPDGSAFGVFADTTYRVHIDLTRTIEMISDGPDFGVIVIERDSPAAVVMELAQLTGKIEMPPMWAIGYNQCRYSYYPDSRVREVAWGFRTHDIPADVIWMDIDYMDGYRIFTFDPKGFPNPRNLNEYLHSIGFHTVWMLDPGVKKDENYVIYKSGSKRNLWVKTADGSTDYVGEVWPGECVFPDFTNVITRNWWADLCKGFVSLGIDGVWNDMNEPAIFNVKSKTMPLDNIHRADPELGGIGPHAQYHNIYGMQMVRATRQGILQARPNTRPFVLSRANYLGGQRYAATWSGDNTANWYHLESSVPMVINLGLSGNPFTGPDIGGFAGNGDGEMFARWMGIGALMPFARGHTGKGNVEKEPWSFGEEVEATCRRALKRRYRMLPYLYTLFHETHQTGMPIIRPLFFLDPTDPALRSEDDAFMFGGNVLVIPDLTPNRDRTPALPANFDTQWRQFDITDENGVGDSIDPDLPKLYLKPGTIIPVGPSIQYTGQHQLDPLELIVNLDSDGQASGVLYEDDGKSFDFRDGAYRITHFTASREGNTVVVKQASFEGDWKPIDRQIVVRLLMPDGELADQSTQGRNVTLDLPTR